MATEAPEAPQIDNVTCPFCGLLCDDLSVVSAGGALEVAARGCAKSRALFRTASGPTASPHVDGKPVSMDAAVDRAATLLRGAARPLFVSTGTDVAGMRALLELAERCGGTVDHGNGDALFRNVLALQDGGWISTTLTEVRNRADLLVAAGTDISSRFPRFFERCYGDFETMFDTGPREAWFLGAAPPDLPPALKSRTTVVAVERARLGEVFAALRSLLSGRRLSATNVGGIPVEKLATLLSRMRKARYGVLAWSAADLAFANADLTVQSMCRLVRDLNENGRFAALPLGGNDADLTAMQVATWQTGFPLRVSFAAGAPAYDPGGNSLASQLQSGNADLVFHVGALDPERTPPAADVPLVVLARPGVSPGAASAFIPVGTPGIHHPGHLFRTDNVVALRLRRIVDSSLPSAADVLRRVLAAVDRPA